jgi:hypothetical protein
MVEEQVAPIMLQVRFEETPPTGPEIMQTQTPSGIPSAFFHSEVEGIKSEFGTRISALEMEVRRLKKESIGYLRINSLPNKILKSPLDIVVEADGDGYIARTVDLPIYGNGDDPIEAIDMLKREIESLYDDLMKGDDFTEDWLKIKRFLAERISD